MLESCLDKITPAAKIFDIYINHATVEYRNTASHGVISKYLSLGSQAPVGQNGYMPSHGIVFANSNFKAHDLNEEKDQLPASEPMLQVWDEVAGSKKDDLEWVVRSHVVNKGTQSVISEALKKLSSGEKQLTHVTQDCDKEVFQALSGTHKHVT